MLKKKQLLNAKNWDKKELVKVLKGENQETRN